jgi:hypothetical protein
LILRDWFHSSHDPDAIESAQIHVTSPRRRLLTIFRTEFIIDHQLYKNEDILVIKFNMQLVTMFGVLVHVSISTLALTAYIIYTNLETNKKNYQLERTDVRSGWKDFRNVSYEPGLHALAMQLRNPENSDCSKAGCISVASQNISIPKPPAIPLPTRNLVINKNSTNKLGRKSGLQNPVPIPTCNKSFETPRARTGAWSCYRFDGSQCVLTSCPGEFTPAKSYSGFVQELPPAPGIISPPRNNCRACKLYAKQCAVAPQDKFIYIHVMKAGGSSITNFLKAALCPQNCTRRRCRSACTPDLLYFTDCASALEDSPGFFKWTVTRHPYTRAVSAWDMANRFRRPRNSPRAGLDGWATDPATALNTTLMPLHWAPQASFVFAAGGCPMFDFAGRLDARLHDDLRVVLTRIASPRLWRRYTLHGIPHDLAADRRVVAEATCAARPETWDALTERYRTDFDLFGFSRDVTVGESSPRADAGPG